MLFEQKIGFLGNVADTPQEPKIKFYIEAKADGPEAAKTAASEVLENLMNEWFKPDENGLKRE